MHGQPRRTLLNEDKREDRCKYNNYLYNIGESRAYRHLAQVPEKPQKQMKTAFPSAGNVVFLCPGMWRAAVVSL